jgi:hypothetical protein
MQIVSGSNGKTALYSKDCVFLADVHERKGWTTANSSHGDTDRIVTGNDTGHIESQQISFHVVHAVYKDRFVTFILTVLKSKS